MFSRFGCFPFDCGWLYVSTEASSHEDKGPVTAEAAELHGSWLFEFIEFPSRTANLTFYYKNTLTLKYQPTQYRGVRTLSVQVHTPTPQMEDWELCVTDSHF